MKKTILTSVVAVSVLLSAFTIGTHSELYKVDTKLSSMEWQGEKIAGKHHGTIMFSEGSLMNERGNLSGTFVIDMKSIVNKDMQGENAAKLENHLKSEDFFSAEKFPTSKFVTTSITPIRDAKDGSYTHTVKGNLTIKDKTNEILFDAIIKSEGNKIACVGNAIVDRSKFDVKYGSKSFFPQIGDKMINDEFRVKFNVIAIK